jgi:hypothetical protein
MAIQAKLSKDHILNNFWFDFKNVYFKIEKTEIKFDFEKSEIKIGVRGYADKTARENNANGIFKRVYKIPMPTSDDNVDFSNQDEVNTYCYNKLILLDTELFSNAKSV